MSLLYIALLLVLLFAGIPVGASLILVGLTGIMIAGVPEGMVAQRLAFGLDSFTLIAIPLFLMMGNLMNASGVTTRIYAFAVTMVGHWRAGLAQVNIINSLIFSGMSGSALADAAGMGTMEIRAMKENGYASSFAASITAASATIGPVLPPSTVAVLYAFIADVSVGRMFLAGVVPGLMMVVALMLVIRWRARVLDVPVLPRANAQMRLNALWRALPVLVVPFAMIGGMRTGIFTATEVAAVGALYALVLAAIYWKTSSPRGVLDALRETALSTGAIMIIVAAANVFAWILARERIPQDVTAAVTGMALSPLMLLLVINLILLVLGMILDAAAILILVTPIAVPAVMALGIDPIHFGVVMIVNMMIGMITPPVGLALFVVSRVARVSVGAVARDALPYVGAFLVILILLSLFPGLSLWLPDLVYGASR